MDFLEFFKNFLSKFYEISFIEILIQKNTREIVNFFIKEKNNLEGFIHFDSKFFGIQLSSIANINKTLDFSKNHVIYLNIQNIDLLFSMFNFYINNEELSNSNVSIDD